MVPYFDSASRRSPCSLDADSRNTYLVHFPYKAFLADPGDLADPAGPSEGAPPVLVAAASYLGL